MHFVSLLQMEEVLQGPTQAKEEIGGLEMKQEPMEIEGKKPEIKEDDDSGSSGAPSQSTSPSQPRKKSTSVAPTCLSLLYFITEYPVGLEGASALQRVVLDGGWSDALNSVGISGACP